jgi:hypothetical protein
VSLKKYSQNRSTESSRKEEKTTAEASKDGEK